MEYNRRLIFFKQFQYDNDIFGKICTDEFVKNIQDRELTISAEHFIHACAFYYSLDGRQETLCTDLNKNHSKDALESELEIIKCWKDHFPPEIVSSCWQALTREPFPKKDDEWKRFLCQTKNHYALREGVRYCSNLRNYFLHDNEESCDTSQWIIPKKEENYVQEIYLRIRNMFSGMEFCADKIKINNQTVLTDEEDHQDFYYYGFNKEMKGAMSAIEFCWRSFTIVGDPNNLPKTNQDWEKIICMTGNFSETDNQRVISCIKDILEPKMPGRHPSDQVYRINMD